MNDLVTSILTDTHAQNTNKETEQESEATANGVREICQTQPQT